LIFTVSVSGSVKAGALVVSISMVAGGEHR
jgi:hypothetical protein